MMFFNCCDACCLCETKYMIVLKKMVELVEDIIAFPGEPITKPNDPIKTWIY